MRNNFTAKVTKSTKFKIFKSIKLSVIFAFFAVKSSLTLSGHRLGLAFLHSGFEPGIEAQGIVPENKSTIFIAASPSFPAGFFLQGQSTGTKRAIFKFGHAFMIFRLNALCDSTDQPWRCFLQTYLLAGQPCLFQH